MGLQWHDDLGSLCLQSGLKGKKIAKAIENFVWNVRMLRGQSDLLRQAKKDCIEDVRQDFIDYYAVPTGLIDLLNFSKIKEAGIVMGLLKDTSSPV